MRVLLALLMGAAAVLAGAWSFGGITPSRAAIAADVAMPPPAPAECQTLAQGEAEAELLARTMGLPMRIIVMRAEGGDTALLILISPALTGRLVFRYYRGCLVEAWTDPG